MARGNLWEDFNSSSFLSSILAVSDYEDEGDDEDDRTASEHLRNAFLKDLHAMAQAGSMRDFLEPARRSVQIFEREFESPVVHRHKPLRAQIAENVHRFIGPHMHVAE